jgi:hypothetical protein
MYRYDYLVKNSSRALLKKQELRRRHLQGCARAATEALL